MWILVFAKYPEPGCVNTRLCPPLTHDEAADVQRASLAHVLARAATCRTERVVLVGTPDESLDAFSPIAGDRVERWPQGNGDLGARLRRAAKRAFACGASGVVFLGADSPLMHWAVIEALPERLGQADASMGPCADGGYYYLALGGPHWALLEDIPWGAPQVAETTRQRATSAGLSLHEAEVGYDIDRFDDLIRADRTLRLADPQCDLAKVLRRVIHGAARRSAPTGE